MASGRICTTSRPDAPPGVCEFEELVKGDDVDGLMLRLSPLSNSSSPYGGFFCQEQVYLDVPVGQQQVDDDVDRKALHVVQPLLDAVQLGGQLHAAPRCTYWELAWDTLSTWMKRSSSGMQMGPSSISKLGCISSVRPFIRPLSQQYTLLWAVTMYGMKLQEDWRFSIAQSITFRDTHRDDHDFVEERLEGVGVGVAVQDDVVGHAEALSHSQVVEERGLAEGIRHLHHSNVWWEETGTDTRARSRGPANVVLTEGRGETRVPRYPLMLTSAAAFITIT
ncbi:hypothetical protein EYF80_030578 [Liparis tanakae]|uniref:Uncharacterized protein n=1 Tax=Liparis tanakae TaxID=230148 RepID=A0A4Z2H1J6_9TELE|nr:hypothetical protein EYF80_030578 [Liparis tanakae]